MGHFGNGESIRIGHTTDYVAAWFFDGLTDEIGVFDALSQRPNSKSSPTQGTRWVADRVPRYRAGCPAAGEEMTSLSMPSEG
jgi:hypothetical protein